MQTKTFTDDKGGVHMLKEFAWNIFIRLGIIESYMLYRETEEKNRTAEQRNLAEAEAAISAGNA